MKQKLTSILVATLISPLIVCGMVCGLVAFAFEVGWFFARYHLTRLFDA